MITKDAARRLQRALHTPRIALCLVCCAALGCSTGTTRRAGAAAADQATTVRLAHDHFEPALRLARASRANGDLASAINLYEGVVAVQPTDPGLLVEFGDTLVDAGSLDAAIEVYEKVRDNLDAQVGALLGLQRAYLRLEEPEKALQLADRALGLAPQDHRVLISRGVALDMLGAHAAAQAEYRAVLVGYPHDMAARNDLALSLALTRQFEEAADILKPMANSANATPQLRQNLALIYGMNGDGARADALSRIDLDDATAEGNLRFFEFARGQIGK